MKVFISGKITDKETGLPIKELMEKFYTIEYFLTHTFGFDVVNPIELCRDIEPTKENYPKFLGRCIESVLICDAIFMLDNWKDSDGSMIENYTAIIKGKEIMFESDGYKQQ